MLVNELRQKKAELVEKMKARLDLATKESRDFTEAEEKEYTGMEVDLGKLDEQIKKEEAKEARAAKIETESKALKEKVKTNVSISIGKGEEGDFRNFGEFLYSVAKAPTEGRVQQMKDGTSGGFAVPTQFLPELMRFAVQGAVVRPRARVIPAGTPPDAEIIMPALNQGAAQNIHGGVTISHDGEGDVQTETNAVLRQISLKPKRLSGLIHVSNKLLVNWEAASSLLSDIMGSAVAAAEDIDFMTGNGVNRALGVIEAPGSIDIARGTANQILFADITGMLARLRSEAGAVWVASRTTIPQLANIRDTGNNNLWIQSVAAGLPGTLAGLPLVYNERSPALGSKGDLVLADFSNYLIKDGSGPFIAVSEHFRFDRNETSFRIIKNVDGQPWNTEPLPLEGSTANTVSPFVVLN